MQLNTRLLESARNTLLAVCGLVSVSVAVLVYALLTHDFQIEYVAAYTSRDLSVSYLLSALWAGNDGSLLFWAWLLSVCAAVVVLQKRKPSLSANFSGDENLEELQSHRDTTYSMPKELEFDYQSGILNEDDYETLRNRYKRKAATILRDMDGLKGGTGADDEIEERVMAMRHNKGSLSRDSNTLDEIEEKVLALRQRRGSLLQDSSTVDEIEEKVLPLRQMKRQFCPQCGARHEADDRFCARCGTTLFKEEKR